MNQILNILSPFATLGDDAKADLFNVVSHKKIPKNYRLLDEGGVCRYIYFLHNGIVRGFKNRDGKEITTWFACENDLFTAMYSFITQKPSVESIEALEDSYVYFISHKDLQTLFKTHPEFNLIGRILTERYYVQLEERAISLQTQSATERYQNFIVEHPQILQRTSLGVISSYLGISQETLSRIRKNL